MTPGPDHPSTNDPHPGESGTGEGGHVPDGGSESAESVPSWHNDGLDPDERLLDEDPQPVFAELTEFVEEFFAPVFGRDLKHHPSQTWCPQWWRHAEAVYRLDALWRSWEHLRLDPALGASKWMREHLDHHLPYLLDPRGTFYGCDVKEGHRDRDQVFPLVSPYGEVLNPDPAG